MLVQRVEPNSGLEKQLIVYARNCSWVAGEHLAMLIEERQLTDWEAVFVLTDEKGIWGFCTLLKTDYYPENRYWPWISSIFVDEQYRGRRISGLMIEKAMEYAKEQGFDKVYIPSDMTGFYEKYGFELIDRLVNYGGDEDNVFMKRI